MELNFSSPGFKGYSALSIIDDLCNEISVEIERSNALTLRAAGPLDTSGLHTLHFTQEWCTLCNKTQVLCRYNGKDFKNSWQSILACLKTKPRYFEPGSATNFLEALADMWIHCNFPEIYDYLYGQTINQATPTPTR